MSEARSWMRSPLVGGLIGVFAGGIVILLVESVGHGLFGTASPGDLASVSTPMFGAVLVAWILGSIAASALATYWARSSSLVLGAIVGVVLLAGSIANFVAFPHPPWLIVSSIVLMPAAAVWAASRVRARAS